MAIEKVKRNKGVGYKATYSYTLNGKKKRQCKTFNKKSDALKWLTLKDAEKTKNKILGHSSSKKNLAGTTFIEFASGWLERIKIRVTPGTHKEYASKIENKFIPFFGGETLLTSIYSEDLEKLLIYLNELGFVPKTINLYITLIKQIFKDAYEHNYISEDPTKRLKLIKIPEGKFNYWEKEDIEYFIKHAQDWEFFDFAMMAINTGMRIGELSALRPRDINFEQNQIRVTRSLKKDSSFGTTKGKTHRSIPMNKRVRSILEKRVKSLSPDDLIFTHKGKVINIGHFTDRYWKPFIRKIKVKKEIRFHDLRHTMASNFMMQKHSHANVFILQSLLGHADIKETMKYAHLSPNHLDDAKDVINF